MKTVGIIAYIILGIWAIFSFDTAKINLVIRYYTANLMAQPIKIISSTLALLLLFAAIIFLSQKALIKPISVQIKNIEPALENFKSFNIEIDSLKITKKYITLYERLKRDNKTGGVKKQVLKFIDEARFFYENYPKELNSLNMGVTYMSTKKTQVTVVRIDEFSETLLFFCHNQNKEDKVYKSYEYKTLPEKEVFQKILDPIFFDECYNHLDEYYQYFRRYGQGQYGSSGVMVSASGMKPDWILIGVPDPFNIDNNLNSLLLASVWIEEK